MYVNLKKVPSAPKTYVVNFPKLNGGLNIRELNYRLEDNQSPNMKNLWWKDGVLQCRPGQQWLSDDDTLGEGYACYDHLYWDNAFFHIGTKLYYGDPTAETFSLTEIYSGVPKNRGTFFRYLDDLYYKNKGGFVKVSYNGATFTATDMQTVAYTPIVVINASPDNGGGTTYQPENRLSPKKEIHYNAVQGVTDYYLPVKPVDSVVLVKVDGVTMVENTDYTVDLTNGEIVFTVAPDPGTPQANNTVEITYSKANSDALNSVMDCVYGFVAGNGNNLCILLAGCPAQPNAVFWNSNDNLSMNPGYFPMTNYNLCGTTSEAVTGFGKQYDDLILFKESSVGKLTFTVETVDDRDSISFTYQTINMRIGCDLPWSIQLIENNLVFCNKDQGVHLLMSSSAAYENNIQCISENVNGSYSHGLISDVREGGGAVSTDDGTHYWLCANGKCYVWDYEDSSAAKPSWYYFANVHGVCYFLDDANELYHLNVAGQITKFGVGYADYTTSIDKIYSFPTQYFGGYERLKDVLYVIVVVRSETDTRVQLRYDTDYERRVDETPILSWSWRMSPRNLSHRCLSTHRFGVAAKRAPMCKHVRHFNLTLGNNRFGEDLGVISAQIYYRYSGKER
jgi:hypothetical protein